MKDTLIEIKDNIQGINSRADEAKNQVSNLEYKEAKNTQLEEQKEYWKNTILYFRTNPEVNYSLNT